MIRTLWRWTVLTALLAGAGCATRPPWPEPGRRAAEAAGLAEALVLDVEGGPVDTDAEQDDVLTHSEAVEQALRHDPRIQAAMARVRIAEAEARQERLLPNPVLSVVLKFPETGGQPTVEAGLAAELLSLLQRPGRISAADDRLRASSAEAVATVLDVLAQVQGQYARIAALQASLPLLEQRRELVNRTHQLARARFEAGESGRLEVVTLDAERVQIAGEVDDLLLALTQAKLALVRLVGRPSADTNWRVESPASPPFQSVNTPPWLKVAMEHRPEIQQQVWQLKALGAEVRLAGLSFLDGGEAGVEAEKEGDWSVGPGVAVPLPIFDWGQGRRAAAKARRLEARHALTQTRRQVVEQVRRAAAVFNESVHELARARDELLPLQRERFELAEANYRAGESGVLDVFLAEQDLAEAQARVVELELRNRLALIDLYRAVGGPGVAADLLEQWPDATDQTMQPVPHDPNHPGHVSDETTPDHEDTP